MRLLLSIVTTIILLCPLLTSAALSCTSIAQEVTFGGTQTLANCATAIGDLTFSTGAASFDFTIANLTLSSFSLTPVKITGTSSGSKLTFKNVTFINNNFQSSSDSSVITVSSTSSALEAFTLNVEFCQFETDAKYVFTFLQTPNANYTVTNTMVSQSRSEEAKIFYTAATTTWSNVNITVQHSVFRTGLGTKPALFYDMTPFWSNVQVLFENTSYQATTASASANDYGAIFIRAEPGAFNAMDAKSSVIFRRGGVYSIDLSLDTFGFSFKRSYIKGGSFLEVSDVTISLTQGQGDIYGVYFPPGLWNGASITWKNVHFTASLKPSMENTKVVQFYASTMTTTNSEGGSTPNATFHASEGSSNLTGKTSLTAFAYFNAVTLSHGANFGMEHIDIGLNSDVGESRVFKITGSNEIKDGSVLEFKNLTVSLTSPVSSTAFSISKQGASSLKISSSKAKFRVLSGSYRFLSNCPSNVSEMFSLSKLRMENQANFSARNLEVSSSNGGILFADFSNGIIDKSDVSFSAVTVTASSIGCGAGNGSTAFYFSSTSITKTAFFTELSNYTFTSTVDGLRFFTLESGTNFSDGTQVSVSNTDVSLSSAVDVVGYWQKNAAITGESNVTFQSVTMTLATTGTGAVAVAFLFRNLAEISAGSVLQVQTSDQLKVSRFTLTALASSSRAILFAFKQSNLMSSQVLFTDAIASVNSGSSTALIVAYENSNITDSSLIRLQNLTATVAASVGIGAIFAPELTTNSFAVMSSGSSFLIRGGKFIVVASNLGAAGILLPNMTSNANIQIQNNATFSLIGQRYPLLGLSKEGFIEKCSLVIENVIAAISGTDLTAPREVVLLVGVVGADVSLTISKSSFSVNNAGTSVGIALYPQTTSMDQLQQRLKINVSDSTFTLNGNKNATLFYSVGPILFGSEIHFLRTDATVTATEHVLLLLFMEPISGNSSIVIDGGQYVGSVGKYSAMGLVVSKGITNESSLMVSNVVMNLGDQSGMGWVGFLSILPTPTLGEQLMGSREYPSIIANGSSIVLSNNTVNVTGSLSSAVVHIGQGSFAGASTKLSMIGGKYTVSTTAGSSTVGILVESNVTDGAIIEVRSGSIFNIRGENANFLYLTPNVTLFEYSTLKFSQVSVKIVSQTTALYAFRFLELEDRYINFTIDDHSEFDFQTIGKTLNGIFFEGDVSRVRRGNQVLLRDSTFKLTIHGSAGAAAVFTDEANTLDSIRYESSNLTVDVFAPSGVSFLTQLSYTSPMSKLSNNSLILINQGNFSLVSDKNSPTVLLLHGLADQSNVTIANAYFNLSGMTANLVNFVVGISSGSFVHLDRVNADIASVNFVSIFRFFTFFTGENTTVALTEGSYRLKGLYGYVFWFASAGSNLQQAQLLINALNPETVPEKSTQVQINGGISITASGLLFTTGNFKAEQGTLVRFRYLDATINTTGSEAFGFAFRGMINDSRLEVTHSNISVYASGNDDVAMFSSTVKGDNSHILFQDTVFTLMTPKTATFFTLEAMGRDTTLQLINVTTSASSTNGSVFGLFGVRWPALNNSITITGGKYALWGATGGTYFIQCQGCQWSEQSLLSFNEATFEIVSNASVASFVTMDSTSFSDHSQISVNGGTFIISSLNSDYATLLFVENLSFVSAAKMTLKNFDLTLEAPAATGKAYLMHMGQSAIESGVEDSLKISNFTANITSGQIAAVLGFFTGSKIRNGSVVSITGTEELADVKRSSVQIRAKFFASAVNAGPNFTLTDASQIILNQLTINTISEQNSLVVSLNSDLDLSVSNSSRIILSSVYAAINNATNVQCASGAALFMGESIFSDLSSLRVQNSQFFINCSLGYFLYLNSSNFTDSSALTLANTNVAISNAGQSAGFFSAINSYFQNNTNVTFNRVISSIESSGNVSSLQWISSRFESKSALSILNQSNFSVVSTGQGSNNINFDQRTSLSQDVSVTISDSTLIAIGSTNLTTNIQMMNESQVSGRCSITIQRSTLTATSPSGLVHNFYLTQVLWADNISFVVTDTSCSALRTQYSSATSGGTFFITFSAVNQTAFEFENVTAFATHSNFRFFDSVAIENSSLRWSGGVYRVEPLIGFPMAKVGNIHMEKAIALKGTAISVSDGIELQVSAGEESSTNILMIWNISFDNSRFMVSNVTASANGSAAGGTSSFVVSNGVTLSNTTLSVHQVEAVVYCSVCIALNFLIFGTTFLKGNVVVTNSKMFAQGNSTAAAWGTSTMLLLSNITADEQSSIAMSDLNAQVENGIGDAFFCVVSSPKLIYTPSFLKGTTLTVNNSNVSVKTASITYPGTGSSSNGQDAIIFHFGNSTLLESINFLVSNVSMSVDAFNDGYVFQFDSSTVIDHQSSFHFLSSRADVTSVNSSSYPIYFGNNVDFTGNSSFRIQGGEYFATAISTTSSVCYTVFLSKNSVLRDHSLFSVDSDVSLECRAALTSSNFYLSKFYLRDGSRMVIERATLKSMTIGDNNDGNPLAYNLRSAVSSEFSNASLLISLSNLSAVTGTGDLSQNFEFFNQIKFLAQSKFLVDRCVLMSQRAFLLLRNSGVVTEGSSIVFNGVNGTILSQAGVYGFHLTSGSNLSGLLWITASEEAPSVFRLAGNLATQFFSFQEGGQILGPEGNIVMNSSSPNHPIQVYLEGQPARLFRVSQTESTFVDIVLNSVSLINVNATLNSSTMYGSVLLNLRKKIRYQFLDVFRMENVTAFFSSPEGGNSVILVDLNATLLQSNISIKTSTFVSLATKFLSPLFDMNASWINRSGGVGATTSLNTIKMDQVKFLGLFSNSQAALTDPADEGKSIEPQFVCHLHCNVLGKRKLLTTTGTELSKLCLPADGVTDSTEDNNNCDVPTVTSTVSWPTVTPTKRTHSVSRSRWTMSTSLSRTSSGRTSSLSMAATPSAPPSTTLSAPRTLSSTWKIPRTATITHAVVSPIPTTNKPIQKNGTTITKSVTMHCGLDSSASPTYSPKPFHLDPSILLEATTVNALKSLKQDNRGDVTVVSQYPLGTFYWAYSTTNITVTVPFSAPVALIKGSLRAVLQTRIFSLDSASLLSSFTGASPIFLKIESTPPSSNEAIGTFSIPLSTIVASMQSQIQNLSSSSSATTTTTQPPPIWSTINPSNTYSNTTIWSNAPTPATTSAPATTTVNTPNNFGFQLTLLVQCAANGSPAPTTLLNETLVLLPPPAPTEPEVIPKSVRRATQTTVTVMSSVSGMITNPSVPLAMAKVSTAAELSDCNFDHEESLSRFQNPLNFKFGDPHGQYYRGAVIGNLILFVIITSFFVVVALIVGWIRGSRSPDHFESMKEAILQTVWDMHFPSILLLPIAFCYQGMVSVSLSIFLHSVDKKDLAYGVMGMAMCSALLGWITYISTGDRFGCVIKHRPPRPPPTGTFMKAYFWFFDSDRHWSLSTERQKEDEGWKKKWYFLFVDFQKPWYMAFELGNVFLLGIVDGIRINNQNLCDTLIFVPLILALVTIVVVKKLEIGFNRENQWFLLGMNIGSLVVTGVAMVSLYTQEDYHGAANAMETILLILLAIKSFGDILFFGVWVLNRRKEVQDIFFKGTKKFQFKSSSLRQSLLQSGGEQVLFNFEHLAAGENEDDGDEEMLLLRPTTTTLVKEVISDPHDEDELEGLLVASSANAAAATAAAQDMTDDDEDDDDFDDDAELIEDKKQPSSNANVIDAEALDLGLHAGSAITTTADNDNTLDILRKKLRKREERRKSQNHASTLLGFGLDDDDDDDDDDDEAKKRKKRRGKLDTENLTESQAHELRQKVFSSIGGHLRRPRASTTTAIDTAPTSDTTAAPTTAATMGSEGANGKVSPSTTTITTNTTAHPDVDMLLDL